MSATYSHEVLKFIWIAVKQVLWLLFNLFHVNSIQMMSPINGFRVHVDMYMVREVSVVVLKMTCDNFDHPYPEFSAKEVLQDKDTLK